jgi:hypothetical protein
MDIHSRVFGSWYSAEGPQGTLHLLHFHPPGMLVQIVYLSMGFAMGVIFRSHNNVDTHQWEKNARSALVRGADAAPRLYDSFLDFIKRSGGGELK